MKPYPRTCTTFAVAITVVGALVAASSALAAEWKPEKTIEFVVGTCPESGVDNTARTDVLTGLGMAKP